MGEVISLGTKGEFVATRPIAIMLVGAPDTKKSIIAQRFAELASEAGLVEGGITVIDNDTDALEKLDRPVGAKGTYDVNVMLASNQLQEELAARKEHRSMLVIGGVLQRVAHSAVRGQHVAQGIQTPERDQMLIREGNATTLLTCMLVDSMNYTFIFYVPSGEGLIVPDTELEDTYRYQIDAALRQAMHSFNVPALVLDSGTPEEKADKMLEIVVSGIQHYNAQVEGTSEADQAAGGEVVSIGAAKDEPSVTD